MATGNDRHRKRVSVHRALVQTRSSDKVQKVPTQELGASKKKKRKSRRKKVLSDAVARLHSALNQAGEGELAKPVPLFYPVVSKAIKDRVRALDCEMVGVKDGVLMKSAIGRCSIVDYKGEVLFDHYVTPLEEIVDYRTAWSGITRRHMWRALPLNEALSKIHGILDGAIVVGHDLKQDLAVLELSHPPLQTRDTALYKPLRTLAKLSLEHPPSLKNLALKLNGERIQKGPHSSVEDARASLNAYKAIKRRWEWEITQLQEKWAVSESASQSSDSTPSGQEPRSCSNQTPSRQSSQSNDPTHSRRETRLYSKQTPNRHSAS